MSQHIEGSQSSFLFGDFLYLRENPALGRLKTFHDLYGKLIRREHAILACFAWFATGKGNFIIPDTEGPSELDYRFWYPELGDPISPTDYSEEMPSGGYIRLKTDDVLDIVITLHDFKDADYSFLVDNYLLAAKVIQKFEITRFVKAEDDLSEALKKTKNYYDFGRSGCDFIMFDAERKKEKFGKNLWYAIKEYSYKPGFVLVDPRIIEEKEDEYLKNKEKLKTEYGWDVLKTPYELMEEYGLSSGEHDKWRSAIESWYDEFLEEQIISQEKTLFDSFNEKAASCFDFWDRLETQSKKMFVFGDMLFDSLKAQETAYSICIVQYCKVLENELRRKVFNGLMHILKGNYPAGELMVEDYLKELIAKKRRIVKYNLVAGKYIRLSDIGFLLSNVNFLKGKKHNPIAKDILGYFQYYLPLQQPRISAFGKEILKINEYRNRAAHSEASHSLDQKDAKACRDMVVNALYVLFQATKDS